jgi:hypothetical protein
MMIIKNSLFPIRPNLQNGESAIGYVVRFRLINGHAVPSQELRLVRRLYSDRIGSENFENASLDEYTALGLLDHDIMYARISKENQSKKLRDVRGHRLVGIHLCPVCIKESGFHFSFWELPFINACPLHACKLVHRCVDCEREFSWRLLKNLWQCQCGKEIIGIQVQKASQLDVSTSRLILSARDLVLPVLYRSNLDHLSAKNVPDFGVNDFLGALKWADLIRVISAKRHRNARSTRRRSSLYVTRWRLRLLTSSNASLQRRIKFALQIRFQNERGIFVYIPEDDGAIRAIRLIHHLVKSGDTFAARIFEVVEEFLTNYSVRFNSSGLILFNPNIRVEQKSEIIQRNFVWLRQLVPQLSVLDPTLSNHTSTDDENSDSKSRFTADIQVLNFLECLVKSSLFEVNSFKALLHWWRVPANFLHESDSNTLLDKIASYLATRRPAERAFICDLFLRDLEVLKHD